MVPKQYDLITIGGGLGSSALARSMAEHADARRTNALPSLAEGPSSAPDHLLSGPELPSDDSVRRKFFGEE